MFWSGSKRDHVTQKWYRLKNNTAEGSHEIVMATDKVDIEKSEDQFEDEQTSFTHFFQRAGQWYIQENIPYRYLFSTPETRTDLVSPVLVTEPDKLDVLYQRLLTIEGHGVQLENFLSDIGMGMDYLTRRLSDIKDWIEAKYTETISDNDLAYLQTLPVKIQDYQQRLENDQFEFAKVLKCFEEKEGGTYDSGWLSAFYSDVRSCQNNLMAIKRICKAHYHLEI